MQTIVAFFIWFAGSLQVMRNEGRQFALNPAGLDTFVPGQTDLRIVGNACEDLRMDLWRTITYQWTHVGVFHILANSFMNIVLGIPLEGLHGHLRVVLMYNVGVFGGACCYWVGDSKRRVVGMS